VARIIFVVAVAFALVGLGWAAARAQTTGPDFELIVNAPGGDTTIQCLSGCKMKWIERGINPNDSAQQTFTYACSAPRCSSGRVGGWIAP
jgi:hypothetical protein